MKSKLNMYAGNCVDGLMWQTVKMVATYTIKLLSALLVLIRKCFSKVISLNLTCVSSDLEV